MKSQRSAGTRIVLLAIPLVICLCTCPFSGKLLGDEQSIDGIFITLEEDDLVFMNTSVDINSIYEKYSLNISSVPSTNYPKNLTVYLKGDDNPIFQYKGTGYGEFGRQNEFADGEKESKLVFTGLGHENRLQILLPENATLDSATVDVQSVEKVLNWTDPVYLVQDVDGSEVPISTLGQISADFADIDGDGRLDLIKGGWSPIYNASTYVYRNIGTREEPLFLYNSTYSTNISMEVKANPRFVDIDGDSDYDLFIGQYNGRVTFYRNNGTVQLPVWNEEPFLESYVFGYEPCPSFADMDDDGDMDITIGYQSHKKVLSYFINEGNTTAFKFVQGEIYSGLELDELNFPALSDFDMDGDLDLFVGHWEQPLSVFENIGNSTEPIWGQRQRILDDTDFGYYLTPTFADLSGDGYDDIVIGVHNGVLNFLERDVRFPKGLQIVSGPFSSNYDLGPLPRTAVGIDLMGLLCKLSSVVTPSIHDGFQSFRLFNLSVIPDEVGGLTFCNLEIEYSLTSTTRDIEDVINTLLEEERRANQSNRSTELTFTIYSSSDGEILISETARHHRPILFHDIPTTYHIYEDSQVHHLIDIHRYLRYQGDLGRVNLSLQSLDDISNVVIEKNRYISMYNSKLVQFENWTGIQRLSVVAIDDLGFTAVSAEIEIITLPVNDPPVFLSIPEAYAFEDSIYHYMAIAWDVDSDNLSFSIAQGPDAMRINGTGFVTWRPEQKDVGTHSIRLSVSDGEFFSDQSFRLHVQNVNDGPSIGEIPPMVVTRGVVERVDWTKFVFDEDTPLIGLKMETEAQYISVEGNLLVIDVPLDTDISVIRLRLAVSDGELEDVAECWVHVSDMKPDSLLILPLPTLNVFRNRTYVFDLSNHIIFDNSYDDPSLVFQSEYVRTRGLSIEVNVPMNETKDQLPLVMSVVLGDIIVHDILTLHVVDADTQIVDIPTQMVPEDSEHRIDIEQYISLELLDSISEVRSSSDAVIYSGLFFIIVYYPLPESDVIECEIALTNSSLISFTVGVEVISRNDPPELTNDIADIDLNTDGRYEMDLSDYFHDEEGDPIVFRPSEDFIQVTPEGLLAVEWNSEYRGKRITCTIIACDENDVNISSESNSFHVTFGDTDEGPQRPILWVAVITLCALLIVVLLGYHFSRKKSTRKDDPDPHGINRKE